MRITKILVMLLLLAGVAVVTFYSTTSAMDIKKGNTIAFLRNNDVWLMDADGSNQRPWVAGIGNARGRMSWSPDNSKLVFARQGNLSLKYPDGGGGSHMIYDLFFAYADSSQNWWEGITQTMGALAPEFVADGSSVLFVYDQNANLVNSTFPKYRIGFWDTKKFTIKTLDFEPNSEMVAFTPTMSPDMKQLAFVVMRLRGEQLTPAGIAIAKVSEFPVPDQVLEERAHKFGGATAPAWSPDGTWIAYVSNDMANPGLYIAKPDLSEKQLVYKPNAPTAISATSPSWSPDSKMLLFSTQDGAIYKISINGGEPVRLSGPGNDFNPVWCN